MRRLVLLLATSSAPAALAACSPPSSGSGPAHDIAYYRNHSDERAAKMVACRNDGGRLAPTGNCINALAADSEAVSRKFWSVPKPAPRVADPGKL